MRFSIERLRDFPAELRRRRVVQTAIWYVGASVAILSTASSIFFPAFNIDPSLLRPLTIIAIFGLPVALTLSWEFDVYAADRTSEHTHAPWFYLVPAVVIISLAITGSVRFLGQKEAHQFAARPSVSSINPAHVAVLPFTTRSNNSHIQSLTYDLQSHLIDGLSSASAEVLAENRLTVISNDGIMPYVKQDCRCSACDGTSRWERS